MTLHHIVVGDATWCETLVGPPTLLDILEVAKKRRVCLTCDHMSRQSAEDMVQLLKRFISDREISVGEGFCPVPSRLMFRDPT